MLHFKRDIKYLTREVLIISVKLHSSRSSQFISITLYEFASSTDLFVFLKSISFCFCSFSHALFLDNDVLRRNICISYFSTHSMMVLKPIHFYLNLLHNNIAIHTFSSHVYFLPWCASPQQYFLTVSRLRRIHYLRI